MPICVAPSSVLQNSQFLHITESLATGAKPEASFRPDRQIFVLRPYLKRLDFDLDYCAAHIHHMQTALTFYTPHSLQTPFMRDKPTP